MRTASVRGLLVIALSAAIGSRSAAIHGPGEALTSQRRVRSLCRHRKKPETGYRVVASDPNRLANRLRLCQQIADWAVEQMQICHRHKSNELRPKTLHLDAGGWAGRRFKLL